MRFVTYIIVKTLKILLNHSISIPLGDTVGLTIKKSIHLNSGPGIYDMKGDKRGICLIVDNVFFDSYTFAKRDGTRDDAIQLHSVFLQIGYEVIHVRDQTQSELESFLQQIRSKTKLEDYDSLIVIILSHGCEDGVICCRDYSGIDPKMKTGFVTDQIVINNFNDMNCPSLKGKPKIYFFSCCRGENISGSPISDASPSASELKDTFVGYGTQPGCVGWRDSELGSYFGNAIAEALIDGSHVSELDDIFKQIKEKCKKRIVVMKDPIHGFYETGQNPDFIKFGFNKLYFNPKIPKDRSPENIYIQTVRIDADKTEDLFKYLRTYNFIKNISNEKIVQYFSVWAENIFENKRFSHLNFCVQMEACDENLEDLINKIETDTNLMIIHKKVRCLTRLGYFLMSQLFVEILEGVNYLHQRDPQIIHRDLKLENIMLKIGLNNSFVKIGNLNLAGIREFDDQSLSGRSTPNFEFIAPELMNTNTFDKRYDNRVDIYSLGYILMKMLKIDINSTYPLNDSILGTKYEKSKEYLIRMIDRKYTERPDCEDILADRTSWALNADEFNAIQELIRALSEENKDSIVYKILKSKINNNDKFF